MPTVEAEFDGDNVLMINDVPRSERSGAKERGGVQTNEGVGIVKTVKARTGWCCSDAAWGA